MTQQTTHYFFDNAEDVERARLGGIAAMFDPISVRNLTAVGVGPGWRCLEVGAGTGTVARWLAGAVEPDGRVTATDLDTRFLDGMPAIEVLQHDVTGDPLEPGAYDLVHARMVVEHWPTGRMSSTGWRRRSGPAGCSCSRTSTSAARRPRCWRPRPGRPSWARG
jgi:SAM-dependent methyltransferase